VKKRNLGRTGLQIAPLVFGGNVFGWTVDETRSHELLDRFVDAGLNAVDTADVYSTWVPGHQGGESETIIGSWTKGSAAKREKLTIITKVGLPMPPDRKGLSAKRIAEAVEESLQRLRTDYIDVYLTHRPDPSTPIEETLGALDALVKQGKVKAIGSSNGGAEELRAALDASKARGLARFEVHQPEYNLYGRSSFEGALRDLCVAEDVGVIPYYSLASGFLSGKYRGKDDAGKSARGGGVVSKYLNDRGFRILEALDGVAAEHNAKPAEVALAWLMAKPGVTAPIASATSVGQLDSLVRAKQLSLTPAQMQALDAAGA
jgi:aryl-alcohol dehydrogenase-like predicted oxidoreductase